MEESKKTSMEIRGEVASLTARARRTRFWGVFFGLSAMFSLYSMFPVDESSNWIVWLITAVLCLVRFLGFFINHFLAVRQREIALEELGKSRRGD